ncbi:hypothetical protein [Streptomyces sp. NBC_00063]|uniref:hypothetical protein n=1 Tax=Streptomyces sp. NBC_00063 TaxID=2975638 RepID=UPI003D70D0E0
MSERRARHRAPPTVNPAGLDWRDTSHWSWIPKPCRYCGKPTHLRDSRRSPAHKVCAEEALAQQVAEAADAYQNGQL